MGALGTHSLVITELEPGHWAGWLRSLSGPTHPAVSGVIILRNSHFGHSWFYSLALTTTQVLRKSRAHDEVTDRINFWLIKRKDENSFNILYLFCLQYTKFDKPSVTVKLKVFACHFTISPSNFSWDALERILDWESALRDFLKDIF